MADLTKLTTVDREHQKFGVNSNGDVIVRTSGDGTFSLTGLNNGGLITEITLNSTTWTPLPLTPLTNRNALAIQNRSGLEIKINYDNTVVGYVGIAMSDGDERSYDITDAITIYAKSISGTPTITIEELS